MFQDYDTDDIAFMKSAILDKWDLNHDGKINKTELTMMLLMQARLCAEEQGVEFVEDSELLDSE